ncbi:hypothetical protein C8R44DRAFT_739750 [Mycena epipterygia]|nr:hypothetical protein C8R44DRAFT_739750 [Mycena epipterygia]
MPRASKVLDECFIKSENKKKLLCTVCERYNGSGEWILRDGDKKHLLSKSHDKNFKAEELRIARVAAIENQNATINSDLAQFEIPADIRHDDGPEYNPSAAEQDMWSRYLTKGATFSAGKDPTADLLRQQAQLEQQADKFGCWNAAAIARNLGFLADDTLVNKEQDKEDAVLCEMLDNAHSSDEDSSDTEGEARSQKKPRTMRRHDDSDSDYGGEGEEPAQTNAPRTSARLDDICITCRKHSDELLMRTYYLSCIATGAGPLSEMQTHLSSAWNGGLSTSYKSAHTLVSIDLIVHVDPS